MSFFNKTSIVKHIFAITIIVDLFISKFDLFRCALNLIIYFIAFLVAKHNLINASEWWSSTIAKFIYFISLTFSVVLSVFLYIQYILTLISANHDVKSFTITAFFAMFGSLDACIKCAEHFKTKH